MSSLKDAIGTRVRIGKPLDGEVPYDDNVTVGDTGTIIAVQSHFRDMVNVKHDKDGHKNAYWPEELTVIE